MAKKRRHVGLRGLSGTPSEHEHEAKTALKSARLTLLMAQEAKTCRERVIYAAIALADTRQLMSSAGHASDPVRTRLQNVGFALGRRVNKVLFDSDCYKPRLPPR